VIIGIPPSSRKEGWLVSTEVLHDFLQQRLPDGYGKEGSVKEALIDATNVVKKSDSSNTVSDTNELEKRVRAEMWRELVNKKRACEL
jgi:hypothetical protein